MKKINITFLFTLMVVIIALPFVGSAVLSFTQHYVYNEGTYYRARAVEPADIDEDGDMDVIVGDSYYDDLLWYRNDGSENFTKVTIDSTYYRAAQIQVIDLDADGDLDIVGGDNDNYAVFWWENDGSENFTEQTISNYGSDFAIVDLDDDGDYDVITPDWSSGIRWAKNDGSENFTDTVIDASLTLAWTACAGDLTGDGNDDIVFNRYNSNLHLLTNDGSENFSSSILDTGSNTKTLACVDLDGDTDLDIVTAQSVNGNILWFDNNGSGVFTEKIVSSDSLGTEDFQVIDFDGDSDLDIVTADDGTHDVFWFENNGSESFTKNVVDDYYYGVTTVGVADIDGDSDLDVVAGSYENGQDLMWFEAAVDSTNPSVSTLSPTDNATGISTTANLVITFDESVDAEAGANNDIIIKKTSDNSTIETIDAQDAKASGSGSTTITINPDATLVEETEYYVQVGADAFDDPSGNSYAGISDTTSWSFTTGDFTNPSVSTLSPADNDTGVSTTANLVITFDEAVDVESGNIVIKRTSDDSTIETIDVAGVLVTGTGTTIITIDPSTTLSAGVEYYVQIATTAFDDASSNSYAGITDTTSWSFTTQARSSSSTATPAPEPSFGGVDSSDNSDSSSSNASATSVTGSAAVEAGDDIKIQWSSSSSVHLVNVYVSYDGGETYEFVDGPIMNVDNYVFDLPQYINAETVKFKIEGTDLAEVIAEIETDEIEIGASDEVEDCDCEVDEIDQTEVVEEPIEDSSENLFEGLEDIFEEIAEQLVDVLDEVIEEVVEVISITLPTFERDLTLGAEGDDVRQLQEFLNSQGYLVAESGFGSPGNETNYFGDLTRAALATYQADQGLPAFGYFGELTREVMGQVDLIVDEVEEAVQEEIDDSVQFTRDLSLGSTGEDVHELQKYLNKSGFVVAESGLGSSGNETNYFGELTRAALARFQEAMGIEPAAGYFGVITRSFIQ